MFPVNKATLKQVEKFKYLGVAFTSDERRRTGYPNSQGLCSNASFVLFSCHETRIVNKAKLSIFKVVFVPILTCGHESWVVTETERSQVQASEMRILQRIKGVILCVTNVTRCLDLRFKNRLTSSRYFSELKDLSLDGLAM